MEDTLTQQAEPTMDPPNPMATGQKRRGRRAGKRKMGFRMDTPPFPVRAIWELATEQERQAAHQTGVLILEHWLGRMTRKDLGSKLNLPPLRVWQLSQQALAGMVVGLMAQPKRPPKGTPMPGQVQYQDKETKELRLLVKEREQEVQMLRDLLAVLRDMPKQPPAPAPAGKKISPAHKAAKPVREHRGGVLEEAKPKEG